MFMMRAFTVIIIHYFMIIEMKISIKMMSLSIQKIVCCFFSVCSNRNVFRILTEFGVFGTVTTDC